VSVVVVVCPQERDRRAIEAARLGDRFRVRYAGRDLDGESSVDPAAVLAEAEALPADGVVATKDRSALLAAVAAERRGLPGPAPHALFACQHKPTSRRLQLEAAPEAVPRFHELRGKMPPFPPPWFVKPAVGRLSQGARRVDRAADLPADDGLDGYRRGYAEIAALAGLAVEAVSGYLVEEHLDGIEVTLEGYVHRGRVVFVGLTDSVNYPGTASFERFEYPSRLPPSRRAELERTAARVLPALGFDGGFFNAEFFVPEHGPARLIEVNGRLASQFAPLVQALHGRSTYEALLTLACGDDPGWVADEPDGVAVSYVLRRFEDAYVAAVPDAEDGVELLVRPGRPLSEQGSNDVASYRLAIVYAAGATRGEAVAAARARARALRFRLERPRARAAARS
jgi:biotin carboxylase